MPKDTTEEQLYEDRNPTGINFDKYFDIPIEVKGENVPPKIKDFASGGLRQLILDNLVKCGYTVSGSTITILTSLW